MQEQSRLIEELLLKREVKKVEIVIARVLRSNIPNKARAQFLTYRARARLISARPEDAIDDLLAAQTLIPEDFQQPEQLELLGDCYFARFEKASVGFADRNDTLQAGSLYQKVIEIFPDYANLGWVYYQLGRIALTDNHIGQSEIYFRQALFTPSQIGQLTAYCYERLGFTAFYERRDLNTALGFLNKAIDTYPNGENKGWLAQVHTLRSRVLRDMQNYGQALMAAETAVEVAATAGIEGRSSLIEALLTAGELLTGLDGRERDVVNYLQEFLQISKKPLGVDVTWSWVHEMLGDAYFRLGQYESAAEAFRAALQFNPYHPWEVSLHYRIARSCYQKRDYEAAVRAIKQMLAAAETEGEPVRDYRVYDVLGNAHFALKRYAEAVEAYRIALQMAPPNAENVDKIKTYYQFAQDLS
jgi:tetratricopeptide (TPR) repeat protein